MDLTVYTQLANNVTETRLLPQRQCTKLSRRQRMTKLSLCMHKLCSLQSVRQCHTVHILVAEVWKFRHHNKCSCSNSNQAALCNWQNCNTTSVVATASSWQMQHNKCCCNSSHLVVRTGGHVFFCLNQQLRQFSCCYAWIDDYFRVVWSEWVAIINSSEIV